MAPGNKKGLSLEEKRKKMMEIFYETKDVFLLKDLEKIAPKSKGITPMSVKDVVTSLVDDGLVDSEKIGTSIYFWAFPRCLFMLCSCAEVCQFPVVWRLKNFQNNFKLCLYSNV